MLNRLWTGLAKLCGALTAPFKDQPKSQYTAVLVERQPRPHEIPVDAILIVQNGELKKWACFICPCGCKEKIQLSLNPKTRPRWNVSVDQKKLPTISPSIWLHSGCYSHFWIRNGNVEWCIDTGQVPRELEDLA